MYGKDDEGPGYIYVLKENGKVTDGDGREIRVNFLVNIVDLQVVGDVFHYRMGYETWGKLDNPDVSLVLHCKYCIEHFYPTST